MESSKDFDLNPALRPASEPRIDAEAPDGVLIPPASLTSQTTPLSAPLPENPDFEQYQQEHQLWPEMDMETEE